MKIIKKINNNVALALDGNGSEVVVFGNGIGFPSMPYELKDMSKIHRTFYGVNPQYRILAAELPEEMLMVSGEIAELAQAELDCKINPNLAFTLADHLSFAVERLNQGIEISTPFAYDVEHLYPKETKLGKKALEIIGKQIGIKLPDSEVISIAMHFINAEAETDDMHSTIMMTHIILEITQIVERTMDIILVKEGFNYSRFVSHLRYLVQRLMRSDQISSENLNVFESIKSNFPQVYQCADAIRRYLSETYNWMCSDEETLYLMMHINRVCSER